MRKHLDVHIANGIVTVNGEAVTNPIATVAVPVVAGLVGIVVAVIALFVVLPLVGVAVTPVFGVVGVIALAVAIAAALLACGWPIILAALVVVGMVKQVAKRG